MEPTLSAQGRDRDADGAAGAVASRLELALNELLVTLRPEIDSGRLNSLAILSAEPDEGRTMLAMLIADMVATTLDRRVLLIDADNRRPTLHEALNVERAPGLVDVLQDRVALGAAVRPTGRDRQDVLPAGSPTIALDDVLTSSRLERFISEARTNHDLLVFDTAPVTLSPEAVVVAQKMDANYMVVLAGSTSEDNLEIAHRLFERATVRPAGLVINDPRQEFSRTR